MIRRSILTFIFLLIVVAAQAQRPLYNLPGPFEFVVRTSGSMAITRGGRILVSNPLAHRVSILNLRGELDAELDIGKNPQGVFVVPDNLRALAVSDRGLAIIQLESNEVSHLYSVAGQPMGVVSDETTAYISLQDSAEIIAIELETGRIKQRIPTPEQPAALALWGDFLYVTHFDSGKFSLIYLPAAEVVRTIHPHSQAGLSASIEIDPVNGRAFLPQSIINPIGTLENRIIPVVQVIDLRTMRVQDTINLVVADRAVNMPIAVVQPSNRSRLYVAYAGSNDFSVLNLDTGTAEQHLETGANPRAIRFNRDFSRVYIQDAVDGTVSVFDTNFFGLQDQIPSHTQFLDPLEQIGARLFHTSTDPRLSATRLISCASCHMELPIIEIAPPALNQHIQETTGGIGLEVSSVDMEAMLSYLSDE